MAALRSLAVLAVALAVAQVSTASICGCVGAAPYPGYAGAYPGYLSGPIATPGYEEGCCPGPVIEKKTVVTKPVTIPYSYSVPTYNKKCYNTANVDRQVIPSATVSQNCNEQITTVKVPTTDIVTQQQPLCKKTCTTSEYVIQIPIVETTCTSSPLCKKTVRAQGNVITTVAAKTSCAKQTCTSNNVIERPVYQTVCQDYQGAITKTGAKTVLQPEVKKTCVQLPPYKCLKPASGVYAGDYAYPAPAYAGDLAYPAPAYGAYPGDLAYPAPAYGAYPGDLAYPAPAYGAYPGDLAYPADYTVGAYPAPAYAGAFPGDYAYPGVACDGAYAPGPYYPAPLPTPLPTPCGC